MRQRDPSNCVYFYSILKFDLLSAEGLLLLKLPFPLLSHPGGMLYFNCSWSVGSFSSS